MKRGAAVAIEHADRLLFLPRFAETVPWLGGSDTGGRVPAFFSASPNTTSKTVNELYPTLTREEKAGSQTSLSSPGKASQ
jgi:hypothetical protein